MSYLRPTMSSMRRARTTGENGEAPQGGTGKSSQGNRLSFAFGSLFRDGRKRLRGETSTRRYHEREVRLSQELTKQCDAAIRRASVLLDKAVKQEQLNQTLLDNVVLSPNRAALSPKASGTVGEKANGSPAVLSRGSAVLSTPGLKAPPPTPEQDQRNEGATAGAGERGGWLGRLFRRSSGSVGEAVHSPKPGACVASSEVDHGAVAKEAGDSSHRSSQQRSACLPTVEEVTPGQQRKSVTFNDDASLETLTPPPRMPDFSKDGSGKAEATKGGDEGHMALAATQLADEHVLLSEIPSQCTPQFSPAPRVPSAGKSATPSPGRSGSRELSPPRDVGAIIREKSNGEAYRDLSKEELLSYVKQHHISVKKATPKKQLFEVGRRIAEEKDE